MVRIGFWAVLASAVLPGVRHADVFKSGINAETLGQAFDLTMADLATVCVRNPSGCEAARLGASMAAEQAKAGMLAAYHGFRTQFEKPDELLKTGGIQDD